MHCNGTYGHKGNPDTVLELFSLDVLVLMSDELRFFLRNWHHDKSQRKLLIGLLFSDAV